MIKIDNNKIELLDNIKENYLRKEVDINVEQPNPFQLVITISKQYNTSDN